MSTFSLTKEQISMVEKWKKQQDQKVAKIQRKKFANYGALGGGYVYSFAPTGLGMVVKVTNTITEETIDVSGYDMW